MSASESHLNQLRRMTAETSIDSTYTDPVLAEIIERYPVRDEQGEAPYTLSSVTTPPEQVANESWIPTYDLAAAAAEIWDEKAGDSAGDFDFSADGGSYTRSQTFDHARRMANLWRSRKRAVSVRVMPAPRRSADTPWIGNLPEAD